MNEITKFYESNVTLKSVIIMKPYWFVSVRKKEFQKERRCFKTVNISSHKAEMKFIVCFGGDILSCQYSFPANLPHIVGSCIHSFISSEICLFCAPQCSLVITHGWGECFNYWLRTGWSTLVSRTFMYVLVFPLLSVICAVNEMLEFQCMFYSTVNVSVHSS